MLYHIDNIYKYLTVSSIPPSIIIIKTIKSKLSEIFHNCNYYIQIKYYSTISATEKKTLNN